MESEADHTSQEFKNKLVELGVEFEEHEKDDF